VEPFLNCWPLNKLRKRALSHILEHIQYEDETTQYVGLSPVNKVLSTVFNLLAHRCCLLLLFQLIGTGVCSILYSKPKSYIYIAFINPLSYHLFEDPCTILYERIKWISLLLSVQYSLPIITFCRQYYSPSISYNLALLSPSFWLCLPHSPVLVGQITHTGINYWSNPFSLLPSIYYWSM
jgi:hypothetical protein